MKQKHVNQRTLTRAEVEAAFAALTETQIRRHNGVAVQIKFDTQDKCWKPYYAAKVAYK